MVPGRDSRDSRLELAERMGELSDWLDAQEGQAHERESLVDPPVAGVGLTIDPASTSPAASFNRNRVCLRGTAGGLTRELFDGLPARFARRGVKNFFVWLSPGPDDELVRDWLSAAGYRRVPWTRYPTLLHTESSPPPREHGFDVRRVEPATFPAMRADLGDDVFDAFAPTIGLPGFHHFVALDGDRAVASAALVQFGDLGYLTYACTAEPARNRGAHSALVAHRVALARTLGCTRIVTRTLTMLEQSCANLERAGFREVFEQDVFEFSPA